MMINKIVFWQERASGDLEVKRSARNLRCEVRFRPRSYKQRRINEG